MKLLAELLFHSSYDRATQERLIGPLSKIAVAWFKGVTRVIPKSKPSV